MFLARARLPLLLGASWFIVFQVSQTIDACRYTSVMNYIYTNFLGILHHPWGFISKQALLKIGPPVGLTVEFRQNNISRNICIDAYSHPNHPVQYSFISITLNDTLSGTSQECVQNRTLAGNSSCLELSRYSACNVSGGCKTLDVAVQASNSLGSSTVFSSKIFITGTVDHMHGQLVFSMGDCICH